ncbi:MAG TPA: alkaline phosphatase family protein [Actinomycetota bacterium]|nr:alkaline phosphatase family protein [Actinomycetota bacterium]
MPPRRVAPLLVLVSVLTAAALLRPPADAGAQSAPGDLVEIACSLPHEQLLRTWRGWRPDRAAQLSFLPKEPNFVGSGLPHVGPWDYMQTVPMFWYGPGFIEDPGEVDRPVTSAGIAPTAARLLKFDGFEAPDGQPMTEALLPGPEREVPRLIVTMVWDAAGINVLEAHADALPYTTSLIPRGTWYTDATVGSSPTSTAQIHATIGTGSFPMHHGLTGHNMLVAGRITAPWNAGPTFFLEPTLADVYDRAMGNEPVVGLVGTVDIHFGMLGHGSFYSGGDRDIALTRSVIGGETLTDEGFEWNLPERDAPYYQLAGYANDVGGFERDKQELDRADGSLDGEWRDNDIEELLRGFDTPARTPYQQRVVEQVIRREGFGDDEVPDLLYLNFKAIDYVSHVWSMNSLEMRDAVAAQDRALEDLVTFLDRRVGKGEWAMVVTADHASMPDPAVSGGFQVSTGPMQDLINGRFGRPGGPPIVDLMQPTQAFLNMDELEANGHSVDEVARFMMTFTQAQTAAGGIVPHAGQGNDIVMAAAFPSALMQDLPCLPEARQT